MKRISVDVKTPYEIIIERGIISSASEEIKKVYQGKELFIVTDERVAALYLEKFTSGLKDFNCHSIIIEGYEKSKSIESYSDLCSKLIDCGIRRNHMLIALGGGVIGDLTGFIAGTIYRGVDFIQVPTTLLAQTDSSIGGKTGINIKEGKNLIGVFNQPKCVIIDPETLNTLPIREYNCGLAELIKHGLIRNKSIVERLEASLKVDDELLADSIIVKRDIVIQDELDTNIRMILNFGHTFGHAIEKEGLYKKYNHGEAVGLGMLMVLRLGESLGITEKGIHDRVLKLFKNLNFVTEDYDIKKYLPLIFTDKKNIAGVLNFIMLNEIGVTSIYKVKESEILNIKEC